MSTGRSSGYQVGLRLFHIGMLAPQQRGLREVALPSMQDLFNVTGENVPLGVLSGTQSSTSRRSWVRNSAAARERACSAELRQYTDRTLKDGDELRHRGYAVADQELRPGRVSAAAPVLNHLGDAIAGDLGHGLFTQYRRDPDGA